MSRTSSSPSANGRRGRSLATRSLATAGIAVAAVAGLASPAMANDMDMANDGGLSLTRAIPHNGPISGTGLAHHHVTVSRAGGDVLCHATVGADRTWSCMPERRLHAGHALLKVRDHESKMATPFVSIKVVNTKAVPVLDPSIAAGAALAAVGAAALWYRRRAEQ